MTCFNHRLAGFQPTTPEDLYTLRLLNRYDTKFIFHKDKLPSLFDYLAGDYKILEAGDDRSFEYENLYYDTDDYFFYHQHHNGKLNRYKFRSRRYIQSGMCFFEVKFKNNRRKTIKNRLPLGQVHISPDLSEESKLFAREHLVTDDGRIIDAIKPKLKIEYSRITFANHERKERLTIDTGLTYIGRNTSRRRIDNLAIAELKSERPSLNAALFQKLKELKIFPTRFSKYCIGIAMTEQNVKRNRFKKKLLKLTPLH
jgi:hypothetical protein